MLTKNKISLLGLFLGISIFFIFFFSDHPQGLNRVAWLTAGVALLMTFWWITEAVPIYATGLIPLVFFPILDLLVSTI